MGVETQMIIAYEWLEEEALQRDREGDIIADYYGRWVPTGRRETMLLPITSLELGEIAGSSLDRLRKVAIRGWNQHQRGEKEIYGFYPAWCSDERFVTRDKYDNPVVPIPIETVLASAEKDAQGDYWLYRVTADLLQSIVENAEDRYYQTKEIMVFFVNH